MSHSDGYFCAYSFCNGALCSACIFLPVAWGWGDPHITTLDGRRYTFNGWGEYVMLRTNIGDFEFQGRTQLAANSNATIFSAFVIREGNDTVQVSC